MNFLKTFAFVAVTAAMMTACGRKTDISVSAAEDQYDSGRYAVAQTMCDSLILGEDFDALTVDELCRLSMLASRLADRSDEEANMALAARCMQAAIDREPDSVLLFVQSLTLDDQPRSLFIRQLTHTVDPSALVEEPDSIGHHND